MKISLNFSLSVLSGVVISLILYILHGYDWKIIATGLISIPLALVLLKIVDRGGE